MLKMPVNTNTLTDQLLQMIFRNLDLQPMCCCVLWPTYMQQALEKAEEAQPHYD